MRRASCGNCTDRWSWWAAGRFGLNGEVQARGLSVGYGGRGQAGGVEPPAWCVQVLFSFISPAVELCIVVQRYSIRIRKFSIVELFYPFLMNSRSFMSLQVGTCLKPFCTKVTIMRPLPSVCVQVFS